MSPQSRSVSTGTAIAATAAGIGLCFVVAKYRAQIFKQLKLVINYSDPLRNQQIHVVSGIEECRTLMRKLKTHCDEYNVLGFDCEWVIVGGSRRPVALLQLASHRGLCALIRLSHLGMIPSELKEILEDDNIIKVGVAPQGDADYLVRDYGVCVANTFDLRYMAAMSGCRPAGLGKMTEDYLKVKLDKNWRIRCSDWEAPALNEKQLDYAAKDAHVGVELFKYFAARLRPKGTFEKESVYLKSIVDDYCFRYLDLNYNGAQVLSKTMQNPKFQKKSNNVNPNKLKDKKIVPRQKPLYNNCFLETSDGELLCAIDGKKAMWYVEKELGVLVKEDPLTVRLKFEPAGRAVGQTGKYYQMIKENKCVVCGETEEYNRKNVVPREYRKHFPPVMKSHTSHDIVLLCARCHQICNMHELNLREKLARECNAPISPMRTVEIPRLKEIKGICRVLYSYNKKVPEERKEALRERLKKLCPDETEFSDEFLQSYINIDTSEINENYTAHGEKVVEYYKNSEQGLIVLEKMWREHFLERMKPQFLPPLWSIEHNVERLQIRANEGRIDEIDLKLAGLDHFTIADVKSNTPNITL